MAKPGDFFVGVTDLFSVLLPGAVLTFFAMRAEQSFGHVDLFGLMQLKDAAGYTAFVVSSFLLGHLADMAGASVLDHIYDSTYAAFKRYPHGFRSWIAGWPRLLMKQIRESYDLHIHGIAPAAGTNGYMDPVYAAARSMGGPMPKGDRLYQWCRDWLQVHSPQSVVEPDRLQANSKFFRSLVVVSTLAGLYWPAALWRTHSEVHAGDLIWIAAALFVAALSFLRYCDLRWKAVQHVYRLYVIGRGAGLRASRRVNRQNASERLTEADHGPEAD